MSEERALILEMLRSERVTVEQADQLLEALGAAAPIRPHEPATGAGRQRQWDGRDERVDDFLASLTPKQLIKLRDHDVSGAFVQQMRAAGLGELNIADLIKLHDHGVTPHFVTELREAGLAALTRDDLLALCDHGVDAAFVREMRALGFDTLVPDALIELYNHGVDGDIVREMRGSSDQSHREGSGE